MLSAAPVAAKEAIKESKTEDDSKKAVYRPQELPIYSTVFAKDVKK